MLKRTAGRMCHNAPCVRCDGLRACPSVSAGSPLEGARGFPLGLTIIGVPLGLANFKIIPVTLVPLGVRIVPEDSL